jgi:hypothetical protein
VVVVTDCASALNDNPTPIATANIQLIRFCICFLLLVRSPIPEEGGTGFIR